MAFKATKEKSNIPATSIDDTNLFLNNMVSEDDRKTFDMHKAPSYFKTICRLIVCKYISRYDA
jgi:hypothetical protein